MPSEGRHFYWIKICRCRNFAISLPYTFNILVFFDPILFSLCPRLAPRRGFVLLFHVKKIYKKYGKNLFFT